MKVTYEIENGKKVKVKTYADGRVYKYDEKRNLIYYKDSDGFEECREYSSDGKETYYKGFYGFERWHEYNSNGNEIHYKDNRGCEQW